MRSRVIGIIPLYGKNTFLEELLESIKKQTFPFYRIIVIDNGGRGEKVCRKYEFVYYLKMPYNLGYATGVFKGFLVSSMFSPDYIAVLNDDVVLDKNWLRNGIKKMEKDKNIWAVTGKIIFYNKRNMINSTGVVVDENGYGYDRGFGDSVETEYEEDVLSPSGAGMILKWEAIKEVGLFDLSLYSYYEDLDLGMRIWNRGGKVKYVDTMIMYHRFSASTDSRWKEKQMRKNRLYILLKHFSWKKYISALIEEIKCSVKDKRIWFHLSVIFSSFLMISECLVKREKKKKWYYLVSKKRLIISEDFYDYASVYMNVPDDVPSSIIVGYNDKLLGSGWTTVKKHPEGGLVRFVKGRYATLFSSCKKCKLVLWFDDESEVEIINGKMCRSFQGKGYSSFIFNSRSYRIDIKVLKGKVGFVSLYSLEDK